MKNRPKPGLGLLLLLPTLILSILGTASSARGIVGYEGYAPEIVRAENMAVDHNAVNLLVYATLIGAAVMATRQSLRGYLVWFGLLLYSSVFFVSAGIQSTGGPWLAVYVAAACVSIGALLFSLLALDVASLPRLLDRTRRSRITGGSLIVAAMAGIAAGPMGLLGDLPRGPRGEQGLVSGYVLAPFDVWTFWLMLPASLVAGVLAVRALPRGLFLCLPVAVALGSAGAVMIVMVVAVLVHPVAQIFAPDWIVAAISLAYVALAFVLFATVPKDARVDVARP